jgi:hypothetical protein
VKIDSLSREEINLVRKKDKSGGVMELFFSLHFSFSFPSAATAAASLESWKNFVLSKTRNLVRQINTCGNYEMTSTICSWRVTAIIYKTTACTETKEGCTNDLLLIFVLTASAIERPRIG